MNIQRKHFFKLLAAFTFLAIGAFWAQTRSSAEPSHTSTTVLSEAMVTGTETVEETVTLSASDLKTWSHGYEWYTAVPYCGPPFRVVEGPEEIAGSIVAGFRHIFDRGAVVFGCPDGNNIVYRGTVVFDLNDIISKAPPLDVFVKSARLHLKKDSNCLGEEMLIADENWLKGIADNSLVKGDPYSKVPDSSSPTTAVDIDVSRVVNNWVNGEVHGGYPNYGFVFKGPVEDDLKYGDNGTCIVRYSDMSLTVTYKYEKSLLYVPPPKGPGIDVHAPGPGGVLELAPVDLALKKPATQVSTYPGGEAYRSVDGNSEGAFSGGSVAATQSEARAWWQVDLGSSRSIQSIKVWNRTEFPERTSDFYVFVSDDPFTSTDIEATKTQVGPVRFFFTSGPCGRPTKISVKKTGRFIHVQLLGTNYL